MVDKVYPSKVESISSGGGQDDMDQTATDPDRNYLAPKGIAFEANDNQLIDIDGSGNLQFEDTNVGQVTLDLLRPMNFYYIPSGDSRTIFENYETVVSDITIDGTLTVDGRLTLLGTDLDDDDKLFQAYDSTGGTTIPAGGVALPLDAETIKDANYTHDNVTNNSRVTVTQAGPYNVSYSVSTIDAANRSSVKAQLRINGTTFVIPSASYSYGRSNNNIDSATASASTLVSLSASDYIEVWLIKKDNTGNDPALISDESWLTMTRER